MSTQPVIEKDEFLERFSQFMNTILESENWKCWIMKDNSKIVAHLFLQKALVVPNPTQPHDKFFGHVTNAYTRPEFRNKGLGSELLKELIKTAKNEQTETLVVWPSDEAVTFYKRAGFSEKNDILELDLGKQKTPRIGVF